MESDRELISAIFKHLQHKKYASVLGLIHRIRTSDLENFIAIKGYCLFRIHQFHEAVLAFQQMNANQLHPTILTQLVPNVPLEEIAYMSAVAVLLDPEISRELIRLTFNDFKHSLCRDYLDLDSFEPLRKVANFILRGCFGDAVTEFIQAEIVKKAFPDATQNTLQDIESQFRDQLIIAYTLCFAQVAISQIATEFNLGPDIATKIVSRLVSDRSELKHYKVNEENGNIYRTCTDPMDVCKAELNTLQDVLEAGFDRESKGSKRTKPIP